MEYHEYHVEFRYADSISNFEWRNQSCSLYANCESEAIRKCKELYGLGIDCLYEIVKVEKER